MLGGGRVDNNDRDGGGELRFANPSDIVVRVFI